MLRTPRPDSAGPLLVAAFVGLYLATARTPAAADQATSPTATPSAAARPAEASSAGAPPAEASSADAPPASSDAPWLRDEQGTEYHALRVPLRPGMYVWLDDAKTHARIQHGLEVEVLSHDDDGLTIKVYRTEDTPAAARSREPSAEDLARVARTYAVDATQGGRLPLVSGDEGLPRRGQWRNGFDVADVDHDGHADIAFGPPRKSRRGPTVFLGDGDGHWRVWQEARFPAIPFDYGDAKVGDLNGDGQSDIVLASHLRGIVAMTGDGHGNFTPWTKGIEFSVPGGSDAPAFTSRAIRIADWNRDGRPDVIALGEGPQLQIAPGKAALAQGSRGLVIYLNNGDGTWTKRAQVGSGSFGSTLAVADVDGDGLLDVVAGSDRRGFRGILNLGQADGSWREVEIPELRPDAIFRAVAVADFDRDGHQDVAVGYASTELGIDRRGIDVLLARGKGWERKTLLADEAEEIINALATGDLDGDGALDLVAVDAQGGLVVLRGDGHGAFARETVSRPETERCAAYGVVLTKVDGKPGDAIVIGSADEPDSGTLEDAPSCPSQGSLRVWRTTRD